MSPGGKFYSNRFFLYLRDGYFQPAVTTPGIPSAGERFGRLHRIGFDPLNNINKVDFCKIIHDTLSALPQDNLVCVDFGCYIGAMLKIIYDLFPPEKRQQVSFHGIDPDRNGIGYCRQNYPFIQAHQGSHEELVNGRLDLPEKIDVVYSNATLGIMEPKAVEQFIEGFAGRTRYFVIGDDIINLNGDFPLIRQGVQRFMHNYGTILKRFGYSVEKLLFPPSPMRFLSGIIIVKRDG